MTFYLRFLRLLLWLLIAASKWVAIVVATLVVAFWVLHTGDSHKGYPYDVNKLV